MSRLPTPGGDDGTWGNVLNDFLEVEHNADGTLKLRSDGTLSGFYVKPSSGIPESDLASAVQTKLDANGTAVQSVNGKSGASITLAAGDVSAIPSSQLGAANGVATLDGSSTLTASQLPSSVVNASTTPTAAGQIPTSSSSGSNAVTWGNGVPFAPYVQLPAPSGDTTGATDAAALQAKINGSAAGSILVFQPGTYWVNTAIQLLSQRMYLGSLAPNGSANAIVKQSNGANLNAVLVSAAYATNSTSSGDPLHIQNVSVDGNSSNNTGTHGILLMNYSSTIRECNVSNTPAAGIVLSDQNSAGTTISNTEVECRIVDNKVFTPGTHGIWVMDHSGSGKITDGYLQNNIVAFSGDVAIRNDRAAGWIIDNNHVYACGNGGAPTPATVAGAGGFELTNCWNTYITNNEVDGFGAVTNGGTHIGINVEQIIGRPSIILGNICSANEGAHTGSSYLYYRVKNNSGSGNTINVLMSENAAHCDTTGGASSVWCSFQPNSGTLNMTLSAQIIDGPSSTATIGSPGTVNFVGSTDFAPGGYRDLYLDYGNRTANVIETMSRDAVDPTSGAPSPSAGTLGLTYFTPDQTVTISTLTSASRGTAQSGATLAKMSLFSIDGSGNLTCIARTASDTTLWASMNTAYSRAIADNGQGGSISSLALTRGQRYAFGVLHVGSSTAPTLAGKGGIAGLMSQSPRRGGYVTGQTDIPASITAATISGNVSSGNYYYGRMN